jgi:hypothetical protein
MKENVPKIPLRMAGYEIAPELVSHAVPDGVGLHIHSGPLNLRRDLEIWSKGNVSVPQ